LYILHEIGNCRKKGSGEYSLLGGGTCSSWHLALRIFFVINGVNPPASAAICGRRFNRTIINATAIVERGEYFLRCDLWGEEREIG